MYTTACERCRRMRMRCERTHKGRDMNEVCLRCQEDRAECITKKRRVGRQAGVKNRKTREAASSDQSSSFPPTQPHMSRDADHLPNPLHVLASEAVRRQTPELEDSTSSGDRPGLLRSADSIVDRYAEWASKVDPQEGRQALMRRVDELLKRDKGLVKLDEEEPSVFGGRVDMSRPDYAPEFDVIALQMLSLGEAQKLFDGFMAEITNGSMYLDPRLHTLDYIRSRSSFLLAVVLAIASTYKELCTSMILHAQLMTHASRLEANVRNNNYKSIEIVQALLLLASWSEVPHTLSREKTWQYVSHATALAVELRLDTHLPYCVQSDPMYSSRSHDMLVRNAHRTCLFLHIHDRNMAMVAGRYPIFPESSLTSQPSLDTWGYHKYDAPLCASVSLRKLVIDVYHQTSTRRLSNFASDKEVIMEKVAEWRHRWRSETSGTLEYDIIAKFSTFVMALTLAKKGHYDESMEAEARRTCEALAFEVCCTTIHHYKSWKGILNSATFDTSMVAFCAIYTIQTINQLPSIYLSDWSLFRLATLQELVHELERQAADRHQFDRSNSMSVVDAMARQVSRGIRLVLNRKVPGRASIPSSAEVQAQQSTISADQLGMVEGQSDLLATDAAHMDVFNQLMYANNAIPFIPQWDLENMTMPTNTTSPFFWETATAHGPGHDWSDVTNVSHGDGHVPMMFDFDEHALGGQFTGRGLGL
ncbi:hypothetical protein IAU60_001390 [Kwoniella sp. DSM 27419]